MDQIIYYFFNWTLISPYLPEIMQGFWVTLQMAVMTVVLGTVLAWVWPCCVATAGVPSIS